MKWDFERFRLKELTKRQVITAKPKKIGPTGASDWLELIQNLDLEKLGALAQLLPMKDLEEGAEPESLADKIMGFAMENPEVTQQAVGTILGGMKQGPRGAQGDQQYI